MTLSHFRVEKLREYEIIALVSTKIIKNDFRYYITLQSLKKDEPERRTTQ